MASATPSAASLEKLYRGRHFLPMHSMEGQVGDHVRTLIEEGDLPPGTRLPGIRELARAWNTNYCTVRAALSRLNREGLLHQRPRLGTFVTLREKVLRRVMLAHSGNLVRHSPTEFLSLMHLHLYERLCMRGIQAISFFEQRPPEEQETIPEEVADFLRAGRLDVVVFTYKELLWSRRLGIPSIQTNRLAIGSGADLDTEAFATLAIHEAHRQGCRRVAAVLREGELRSLYQPLIRDLLKDHAARLGMEIVFPSDAQETEFIEEGGYRRCCEALAMRPDGLIVAPDTVMGGAIAALVERRIDIPRELVVISHRNREITFSPPFPVSWITCSVGDFADAALERIEAMVKGTTAPFRKVPVLLEAQPQRPLP